MQTASFKDVCALFVKKKTKRKGKKMVPQGFRSFWILPVEVDGSWFDFLLWLLESNRFLNVGQTLQKKKNLSISFCSSSPNTSTILFFFFFFTLCTFNLLCTSLQHRPDSPKTSPTPSGSLHYDGNPGYNPCWEIWRGV